MKNYVKTYLKYFGYDVSSFIPCEVCGGQSVDIHHLRPKSLEKKLVNEIHNLMALCRKHHDLAHSDRCFSEGLQIIHRKKLLGSKHDNETQIYPT